MKLAELLKKYNLDETNNKFVLLFPDGYTIPHSTNIEFCAFYIDTFMLSQLNRIVIQSDYFSKDICDEIKKDVIAHVEEYRLFKKLKET